MKKIYNAPTLSVQQIRAKASMMATSFVIDPSKEGGDALIKDSSEWDGIWADDEEEDF